MRQVELWPIRTKFVSLMTRCSRKNCNQNDSSRPAGVSFDDSGGGPTVKRSVSACAPRVTSVIDGNSFALLYRIFHKPK